MSFLSALVRAPRRERGAMDVVLAAVVIALLGFGVVMVYSASVIEATVVFRDPQYFLKRQAVYAGGAFALMLVMSHIDYHRWRPLTYPILGLVTALMVLSVVGFGHTGGGAARWLAIARFTSSPRKRPSWRSCCGWPTRSKRSATRSKASRSACCRT